jgi:hypothetical protein
MCLGAIDIARALWGRVATAVYDIEVGVGAPIIGRHASSIPVRGRREITDPTD